MSWNPFVTHLHDEDMCLCRDFISVVSHISNMTTNIAWQAVGQRILAENNMQDKMQRFNDLSARTEVDDCYPTDRSKLMKNAGILFDLVNAFGFDERERASAIYSVSLVVKKMGFLHSEKEQLIKKHLLSPTGDAEINNLLMNSWLELF